MAMLETANKSSGKSSANLAKHTRTLPADNVNGYEAFEAGSFTFQRDEYFARISWPGGSHVMPIDYFLRALMRDVAWNFFYGTVNFDSVIGTTNYYGEVVLYAGLYNDAYRKAGREISERFASDTLMGVFKAMIRNWTNEGYDPFAAPLETGAPWGRKHGNNNDAVDRLRVTARRMVGLPGDTPLRTDESGFPVNRMFADVPQEQPKIEAEPGFEDEVSAFNLFGYLSRSDVTWNPSVCSVVKDSLFCPTSEEFILPVDHGNDRCEWFVVLTDEIVWDVKDKASGKNRARVIMKAGDVSCMPADIRHTGYADKRSMLLVWENASPKIPELIQSGKAPVVSVSF
jgi:Hydroquinone 1,2-dioxygenase large subunit N-terminal